MSDGTGEDSYQEKTGINVTKSLPVRFSTLQGGSRDQPYKPGQSGKFVVNHPISILPNHLKVSSKIFSDDKLVGTSLKEQKSPAPQSGDSETGEFKISSVERAREEGRQLVVSQSTDKVELTTNIRQLENELKEKNEAIQKEKKESGKLKEKNSLLDKRLKEKDKELEAIKQQQEAIKQQLERELAEAKKEVELVKERFEVTKLEELKKQLNELEKEIDGKVEQLQLGEIKIKRLEEQLSKKEKGLFDMQGSTASVQKERERLSKEVEEKKEESDKNIAYATQHIDELERKNQELLQAIKNLTEENERLRVGGSEREKLTSELNEKDAKLEEWRTRVTKLEEEMDRIRIEEGEKRAELENGWRKEIGKENQQKTDQLTFHLQEKMKAKYSERLKEWEAKFNEVDSENKKLKDELSETEAKRLSQHDILLKLKNQLQDKERKCTDLNSSLEDKNKTTVELRKQITTILQRSTEKEQELSEKIKLMETENAIIKEDFESERSDRERIHAQLTVLQEELVEKEQILADAQMKYHNFQQSHSTAEHDLEVSKEKIVELLKKDAESSETIKSLTEEKRKMDRQLKEMKAMETERIKEMEEEIQVLTAQVNAYSRECEKQKGLVAQNQKRHKTEIQVLNEKLTNEQKSKQQLVNELNAVTQKFNSMSASEKSNQQLANELRQQVDTLTASKESLLKAYNQEKAMVTSLQQKFQRMREESAKIKEESAAMKKANEVLKDKVLNLQQQPSSQTANPNPNIPTKISMRQNTINSAPPTGSNPTPPTGRNPTPAQQGGGKAEIVLAKSQQVAPSHAEQPDSVPDDTPHMSKEEIARLFKWQDQQDDSGRATVTQRPQQVEDSLVKEQRRQELAQKADEALREVERERKQPPRRTMLPHTSSKQEPVNQRQPKKKIKQQQAAADDSDSDIDENPLLKGIDDEIQEMAEEVREMSRRPDTQEVLFDDEDSSLPYDPNLVCPKCGRQYRVGEIQKLKRHMVEFCTGKR